MVKKKITNQEYIKKVIKFSDEDFLEMYHRGMSDLAISKVFGVNQSTIWDRRAKLGLIANHNNHFGKNLTKEELNQSRKKRIKRSSKTGLLNYYPKHREEILKRRREYYAQNPNKKKDVKEYQGEYRNKDGFKEYQKEYQKEYYQRKKAKRGGKR